MNIRLGYVAIALSLPKITTSSTVTYSNYCKLKSDEDKLNKLKKVTLSNITALEDILKFNIEKDIHFYRLTSKLVPLSTHPDVMWDYLKYFERDFKSIGALVCKNNLRIDTHPDEFNVLNSTKPHVVQNTITNLSDQLKWFKAMNYSNGKMILHIGGGEGGKDAGLNRFKENIKLFPKDIVDTLIIENDDKLYTAKETLSLCEDLNLPMVLDVHHHYCNKNNDDSLLDILPKVFNTWINQPLPAKFHYSTPRDGSKDRKHADFINAMDFIEFIEKSIPFNKDMDIMLEAKQKDLALFQLVNDIKSLRPNWIFKDSSTLVF